MTQLTETFNGTPSQFWAVMQEFEADQGGNGSRVAVDLTEPMRAYTYDAPSFDMFASRTETTRFVDMIRTTTQTRHEPDVNASTPRVVLQVYLNGDETILWVTAMQMPSGKTQIKGRSGRGDSAPLWTLIVDYLGGLGWIGSPAVAVDSELVDRPAEWVEELQKLGISRGTVEWWNKIESLVIAYRKKYGKRSLPVSGRLEAITAYSRQQIYAMTSLGDKTSDTC